VRGAAMNRAFDDAVLFARTIPYCMTAGEKRRRVHRLLDMIRAAQGRPARGV